MTIPRLISVAIVCLGMANLHAQEYTNFIRQVMLPLGVQWDVAVASKGERNSLLPIDLGGSRYELWTVKNSPLTSYLLDSRYVGSYSPTAEVTISSEDPYSLVPRTRADRPFSVDITISGLVSGSTAPDSAKSVKLLRHVQSYGAGGVGENLNRGQATLLNQAIISENGVEKLNYTITSVPAENLTKTTGEERFSVFTLADQLAPASQLASRYIQIWPMADGTIAGIAPGEKLRGKMPQLTLTLNDLYPSSDTYAQVYQGGLKSGEQGTRVASFVWSDSVPKNKVLVVKDYDAVFKTDGIWTMELLTATPFGIDRLHHVTFEVNRTLRVNTMLSTFE